MAVAELVLEYLQTLVWPAVVSGALFYFRGPIAKKIGGLKVFKMAGAEAEFEAAAQQVASVAAEAEAQKAKEADAGQDSGQVLPECADESGTEGSGHEIGIRRGDLRRINREETARVRASFTVFTTEVETNPNRAIAAAYRFATDEARTALHRTGGGFAGISMTPLDRAVDLLRTQGFPPEWTQVAWTLTRLADASAEEDVTVTAATDFMRAAESLTVELASFGRYTELARRLESGAL